MSKNTPFEFEGPTREFNQGGNSAAGNSEKHNSPRAKGKTVGADSPISKCCNDSAASVLDDSKVTGTARREPSAPAKIRSKNNLRRDQNTALGRGKSSSIVTD